MTYPTSSKTAEFLREALPLFSKAGIEVPVISGGGTPDAYRTHQLAPVNEIRAGTYIYNDRMMIAAKAASLEECALTILATVVSRPTSDRAVIDAGSKTLSSDLLPPGQGDGYGLLSRLSGRHPCSAQRRTWRRRPWHDPPQTRNRRTSADYSQPRLRGHQSARPDLPSPRRSRTGKFACLPARKDGLVSKTHPSKLGKITDRRSQQFALARHQLLDPCFPERDHLVELSLWKRSLPLPRPALRQKHRCWS